MNVIDYILIGITAFYTLIGFAGGILSQLYGLLTIAVSLFAGYLSYEKTGSLFLSFLSVIAAVVGLKIILYIIRRMHSSFNKDKPSVSLSSRFAGALLGGSKGIILAFITLVFIHLLSGMAGTINPAALKYLNKSFFYSRAKRYGLFPETKAMKNIYFAGKLLNETPEKKSSEYKEVVHKLMKYPSFKKAVEDKKLQESIQKKDYKKILSNPNFIKLLKDKKFIKEILYGINYERIYKESLKHKE